MLHSVGCIANRVALWTRLEGLTSAHHGIAATGMAVATEIIDGSSGALVLRGLRMTCYDTDRNTIIWVRLK